MRVNYLQNTITHAFPLILMIGLLSGVVYAQTTTNKLSKNSTRSCALSLDKGLDLRENVSNKYVLSWEAHAKSYNLRVVEIESGQEIINYKELEETTVHLRLPNLHTVYQIELQLVCDCVNKSDWLVKYFSVEKKSNNLNDANISEVSGESWGEGEEGDEDSVDVDGRGGEQPISIAPTTMEADLDSEIDKEEGEDETVQVEVDLEEEPVSESRDDKITDEEDLELTRLVTTWGEIESHTIQTTNNSEPISVAERLEALKQYETIESLATENQRTELANSEPAVIEQIRLMNYPNPFQSTTTLFFTLNQPENVSLTVYNMEGRAILRLMEQEPMEMGIYERSFDSIQELPKGMYLAVLAVGTTQKVLKLQKM